MFHDNTVEVIAINVGEEKEVVHEFITSRGYTFTVLLDRDAAVSSLYNVFAHPKHFIIDPAGMVIGVAEGYRQWDSAPVIRLFQLLKKSSDIRSQR